MEKHIITYFETINPTTGNTISAGYNIGQKWFNSTTGIEYLHKSDGVWVGSDSYSTTGHTHSQYLNLSGGTLSGSLTVSGSTRFGTLTDNVTITTSGITLNGTCSVFDDLTADITRAKTAGTRVTFNDTESSLGFTSSCTLTDYVVVTYQMSHKWLVGSIVYPHIHWEKNSANTPNWLIQYRWQINNGTKTTGWTNYKCNVNAFTYTSGILNQICFGGGINPPLGAGLSDIIQMRIIRDTANTSGLFTGDDNYTGTVSITSADIHYEINTFGSNTEYTK